MDNPNYVLKFNEGVLMPVEGKPAWSWLSKVTAVLAGIIVIGSIIFRENLFMELNWSARILLLVLIAQTFLFRQKTSRQPSPIEIRFYEDYLVVYREKRYYDRKISRKEYNKFYYKDISKCQYRTGIKSITIYGAIEGIWYEYNKDGTLPEEPTYHRTTQEGMCYFYTTFANDIDIVSEIESHSTIKVMLENI